MKEHALTFLATFTVSTLHSFLPSHWLCFVVIGKARQWPLRRILGITAAAGFAHTASTVALGIGLLVSRQKLLEGHEHVIEIASSGLLVGIGLLYLLLHALGKGHRHEHDEAVGEKMAFVSLFLYMTFSPCVPAITIFLGISQPEPLVVGALSALLILSTIGTMMILVAVGYAGVQRMKLSFADRYEKLIIGATLCLLGVGSYVLHRVQQGH